MPASLTICVGLPGSGKSTWAIEQTKINPNALRVNRDTLREMMFGYRFGKNNEKIVTDARDHIVLNGVGQKRDVIVDDTNLSKKLRNYWGRYPKDVAHDRSFETKFLFFPITLEEAIERDRLRGLSGGRSVGQKVIVDMFTQNIVLLTELPSRGGPLYLPEGTLPHGGLVE